MALEHRMIEPFETRQMCDGVISYGVSSCGNDIRVAEEFKIFTNLNSAVVDPNNFDPKWEGFVTQEIFNNTPLPARIYSNQGVAQVLFIQADEPCEPSYADKKGKFQKQQNIELPRL